LRERERECAGGRQRDFKVKERERDGESLYKYLKMNCC